MKLKNYLIVLMVLGSLNLTAQPSWCDKGLEHRWKLLHSDNADSLKTLLNTENLDLVNVLNELERLYSADTILVTLISAMTDLTNTSPDITRVVSEALLEFATSRKDTFYISLTHSLIADAIGEMGRNDEALAHYFIAFDLAKKIDNKRLLLELINSLGSIHMNTGEFEISKEYYKQFLEAAQAINDQMAMAKGYLNVGNPFLALEEYDSATIYFNEALALAKELKYELVEAYALGNLAYIYMQVEAFEKAIEYQAAGLKIEKSRRDNIAMIDSHNVLAGCYARLGNRSLALQHYNQALGIANSINAKVKLMDLFAEGQEIYALLGDYVKAYQVARQYQQLYDSLLNADRNAQIADMREKYETAQKEAAISTLEEEKRISDLEIQQHRSENLILAIVAGFLGVIILMVLYFYIQTRRQKKLVELQNETITKINEALTVSKKELTISNDAKDKLFALVAHDLRGPVTSLQGIGQVLDYYYQRGDQTRLNQIVGEIDGSVNAVSHLLDNLLKWALSQTRGVNYQPTKVDIHALIKDCIVLFRDNARAKEIQIEELLDGQTNVMGDHNMISTIIRNLVSNAIKFSPIGGKVIVALKENDGFVTVSVSDQGGGIPQSTIDQVLNKELATSLTGTKGEKGTGLGLALCSQFIQFHEQELTIISNPDSGTNISFSLALA
ncbi:MAG: tetratricopeptide repeat-containing sensor histidine kinase [Marinoscillum sp.]